MPKTEIDETELLRLHRTGLLQREIAARFGCSQTTVGNRLRRLGIRTGPAGAEAHDWRGGERLDSRGYAMVWQPDHPRVNIEGYVRRSILMWEAFHGRPFPDGKEPHHWNEDKLDDDPRNIAPMTSSAHRGVHNRRRAEKRSKEVTPMKQ